MEEQITANETVQVQFSKIVWMIASSIIITAVVVGGGIYSWRQSVSGIMEQGLQQQIAELQNQVYELETTERLTSVAVSEPLADMDFPIVVYGRAGLLNNTEEGRAGKKNLEEKLINPYTDYYNEDGVNLVAMYIKVPRYIGEVYSVVAIFGSEKQYGTQEFSFGVREGEYDYWRPGCMRDKCYFSEAFKKKYPQILE